MSSSESSGIVGGLFLGLGFLTIVLTPFYLAARYGVHVLMLLAAIAATGFAFVSPWLIALAVEPVGAGGPDDLGAGITALILALDAFVSWKVVLLFWASSGLMFLAIAVRGTEASAEGVAR
jgi:hypothetical protein